MTIQPAHTNLPPPSEPDAAAVGPVLTRLAFEMPSLRSVLVCGSGGRPVAAHGLSRDEAAHLAGLASSLYSASACTARAHHAPSGSAHPVDFVSLASGPTHTLVLQIASPGAGDPLLVLTADDCSLGRLLVQARSTAERVRAVLEGAAR